TVCPACNQANFSRTWKGIIFVKDPANSEVAQYLGITNKGKYSLWVK
ncbi:MAG: transcription elongation factor Spt4, partial [Nanoarchaeota archaeon]|nr:transcription elongation factor Spt4 [Nanoarchaeota archaeon]